MLWRISHLVELERVEKLEQLAVLLVVLQLDVVLLQTVQRQLRVVVHVHFHGLQKANRTVQQNGLTLSESYLYSPRCD